MKYLLIILMLITSCQSGPFCDHSCQVGKDFPKLKHPIVIIAEEEGSFGSSVIVRDSAGTVLLMGNLSVIGRMIGESYNVGDTIK